MTHPKVGYALKETVEMIMGFIPLKLHVIEISYDCEPMQEIKRITKEVIRKAKQRNTLILCDLIGATPYNIATQVKLNSPAHIVAGLNLSMLLSILNYPTLPLDKLAEKAINGGSIGIQSYMH